MYVLLLALLNHTEIERESLGLLLRFTFPLTSRSVPPFPLSPLSLTKWKMNDFQEDCTALQYFLHSFIILRLLGCKSCYSTLLNLQVLHGWWLVVVKGTYYCRAKTTSTVRQADRQVDLAAVWCVVPVSQSVSQSVLKGPDCRRLVFVGNISESHLWYITGTSKNLKSYVLKGPDRLVLSSNISESHLWYITWTWTNLKS